MYTLSNMLYNMYTSIKLPREIWTTLEYKYTPQKQGADKILIKKYFDFIIIKRPSVLDQVHDLQVLISKHKDLGVENFESLQVRAIISKLPPSWNDYQKKPLHVTESFVMDQILKHLHMEKDAVIFQ